MVQADMREIICSSFCSLYLFQMEVVCSEFSVKKETHTLPETWIRRNYV